MTKSIKLSEETYQQLDEIRKFMEKQAESYTGVKSSVSFNSAVVKILQVYTDWRKS